MSRVIVLVVCLAAAGAVAGYTHYSQESADQTPVFTVHVPQRPSAPPPPPVTGSIKRDAIQRELPVPEDRASLVRALQRELRRVGCYNGEISGVWTTSSRMAMKSFTDHVNATLPIDNPDQVLLSLVRGHPEQACVAPCPPGHSASDGRCSPTAGLANAANTATDAPGEVSRERPPATAPAAAAAAAALAASAAVAKNDSKVNLSDGPGRSPAAGPNASTPGERLERSERRSGPVPPERVRERRKRRASNSSRPPKFVRDFLRTFGMR